MKSLIIINFLKTLKYTRFKVEIVDKKIGW